MEAPVSLRNLRNALIVMGAFLALIWILQVVNWADSYRLDQSYGIVPRSVGRLGDIFTAPFLHANWAHIEGNSVPLRVPATSAAGPSASAREAGPARGMAPRRAATPPAPAQPAPPRPRPRPRPRSRRRAAPRPPMTCSASSTTWASKLARGLLERRFRHVHEV